MDETLTATGVTLGLAADAAVAMTVLAIFPAADAEEARLNDVKGWTLKGGAVV